MALISKLELEIFDILANADEGTRLSSSEFVSLLPTKNRDVSLVINRLLSFLAERSLLVCSVGAGVHRHGSHQKLYGLSPVANFFVRNEDGISLGRLMALVQDKVFLDSGCQLTDAVVEEGTLNNITVVVNDLLKSYDYKGFGSMYNVVDVRGGIGVISSFINSKYPNVRCINFDLPHVVQHAPSFRGVQHVGGDMFESVPRGEAIFMRWQLDGLSHAKCLKLLKNCYNAVPDHGKVTLLEALPEMSADMRGPFGNDVKITTEFYRGRERTRGEIMGLATEAGFVSTTFLNFVSNLWIIELRKY